MGQKVNPVGFRLGVYRPWPSKWFARRNKYADFLHEDLKIRKYIDKNLSGAEISKVEIDRAGDNLKIVIYSARPGLVIGKKGQEVETLKRDLANLINKNNLDISVQEIKNAELDANIIAKEIADQIERRISFKKAMKKAALTVIKSGAKGIKIRCAGRLAGAEIARDEWVRIGSVPLHTLRADIDYSLVEAHTTYGVIGVKVWICRGEFKTI